MGVSVFSINIIDMVSVSLSEHYIHNMQIIATVVLSDGGGIVEFKYSVGAGYKHKRVIMCLNESVIGETELYRRRRLWFCLRCH